MSLDSDIKTPRAVDAPMPRPLKITLVAALSLLAGGALALIWSRGTVMLLDLAVSAAGFFCF